MDPTEFMVDVGGVERRGGGVFRCEVDRGRRKGRLLRERGLIIGWRDRSTLSLWCINIKEVVCFI